MSSLSQLAALIVTGLVFGIIIAFVATPEEASAPTDPVPTLITLELAPIDDSKPTSTPESSDPVEPPDEETVVPIPVVPPEKPTLENALENITKSLTDPTPIVVAPKTLNEKVRESIVNIICTSESSGSLNSISASGVIIDAKGIIMTNSHVAQYFLLKDFPSKNFTSCIIRTGSPAQPAYTAELLFLPPSWIRVNADKIDDEAPTGNGDHDYALLRVTGAIGEGSLPTSFPSLPLTYAHPVPSSEVLVAGYPAGFVGGITIAKDLYAASSLARVGELYTYETSTPDLFSIGGTIVAQQGSSGGAVADGNGNLVGLIVTSSIAPDTASRDLRALATSYIARDFEKERGISLPLYLSSDLAAEAALFRIGTAPTLTQALINVLTGN